jgi:hypothetical protein
MSRFRLCILLVSASVAPALAVVVACSDTGTPNCTAGLVVDANGNCVVPKPDAGHRDSGPPPDAGPDAPADAPTDAPVDSPADTGAPDAAVVGAPTFNGATSVSPVTSTQLLVTWDPATDPATPAADMTYAVYMAEKPGGEIYDAAHATQIVGATSLVATSLTAGTEYFFVVRAAGKAGVFDDNVHEVHGVPKTDTTAPTFTGGVTVLPLPSCHSQISWMPATDDLTATQGMTYAVYSADGIFDGGADASVIDMGSPLVTTGFGVTSVTLPDPGSQATPYHQFVVVAIDAADNKSAPQVGDGQASPVSFNKTIQGFLASDCAPGCHTLNTTDKLSPIYDVGYAWNSLTAGGAGVTANVCKPGGGFCGLDAGDCSDWSDGGAVDLVDPGHAPGCSVFYEVLLQKKMPPGPGVQPISACDVVLVQDWITQGAQNN